MATVPHRAETTENSVKNGGFCASLPPLIIKSDTAGELGWDVWKRGFPLPWEPHLAHVPADRPLAGIRQQDRKCGRTPITRQFCAHW
jgi:hypothetical protein